MASTDKNQTDNRRGFFKKSGLLALAGISAAVADTILHTTEAIANTVIPTFELPPLTYAYDALEPHIDKLTMEIHHGKHHNAYVTNLNKAAAEIKGALSLEDLMREISKYSTSVRNNGGGHFNHSFFWKIMKPSGGSTPSGALAEAINNSFGSFETFKTKFNESAMTRFGSGWAWLVSNKGKLEIGSTPNQDNPLMDVSTLKGIPVIAIDVWEHAYYLKHQNKRADYINSWWNVVNWDQASKNLARAK